MSLRSRLSFAIVVFLLPLEAMSGFRSLERLDVQGRRALGALFGVVTHLRALGQRLEAAALDRVVVHEQVLAVVIRRDESEALVVAEPLHGSCGHLGPPPGYVRCETRRVLEATTAETQGTTLVGRTPDPYDECSARPRGAARRRPRFQDSGPARLPDRPPRAFRLCAPTE